MNDELASLVLRAHLAVEGALSDETAPAFAEQLCRSAYSVADRLMQFGRCSPDVVSRLAGATYRAENAAKFASAGLPCMAGEELKLALRCLEPVAADAARVMAECEGVEFDAKCEGDRLAVVPFRRLRVYRAEA